MEENIDELGYEDSNLTISNSKDISGNIHFQFHNKPKSFTGPKKFKTHREDSISIPGVTIPTGGVLHQEFEERNRKVMLNKSHSNSIKIDHRNVIIMDRQATMELFCNPKLVGNIYKAKKRFAFRLTEEICSSITIHKYPVTRHMSG